MPSVLARRRELAADLDRVPDVLAESAGSFARFALGFRPVWTTSRWSVGGVDAGVDADQLGPDLPARGSTPRRRRRGTSRASAR